MTSDLPTALAAAVERVASPAGTAVEIPVGVTGELRRLLQWWHGVAGPVAPIATIVEAGTATNQDAAEAMCAGLDAADRAVDGGANVLLPRVVARDDVAARTVIAVLARSDASALVPQPEGLSDSTWMTTVTAVRDEAFHAAAFRGEPTALLDEVSAGSVAFVVGVLLGAAARQTPCLIDGTDELAAALVADRISMSAKQWWRCGSQSADPARDAAAERADLERGLPLGLTDDDGYGAESTLALLRLLTA